jgi:hypothetical protein
LFNHIPTLKAPASFSKPPCASLERKRMVSSANCQCVTPYPPITSLARPSNRLLWNSTNQTNEIFALGSRDMASTTSKEKKELLLLALGVPPLE